MRVTYLLDRPELGGGVKVVFQHASLLARRGHRVWVEGRGPRPGWAPGVLAPEVTYVDRDQAPEDEALNPTGAVDLTLATYWTTLAEARRRTRPGGGAPRSRAAAHFLQGYEPDWPHQRHRGDEIEAAYRAAALPALVVASHLGEALERRFGLPWRRVPPPVDPRFRPPRLRPLRRRRPLSRPWVVVPGIFEAEIKGVPRALQAVRTLRRRGVPCRLLRISVLPQGEEERRLLPAERYLSGVTPARVAAELRSADLLLFPALPGEGFGLPLLEALASGVPAVASRLPSTEEMAAGAAVLVPPGDSEELAAQARRLLTEPAAWRRASRAGLEAVRPFRPRRVADRLEEAVAWALEAGAGEDADR